MSIAINEGMRMDFLYLCKYIEKYGNEDLPCTFTKPPRFRTMEDFFKTCLEEDKEWREFVTFPEEGAIL